MGDYIDRLEEIEREEEEFDRAERLLTHHAPPLTEMGLLVPEKVVPLHFARTKKDRLFGFDLEHPEEGPVKGYALEGWSDDMLIFFFVYNSFKARIICTIGQKKGKKEKFEFAGAISPGRYADLFTYIDAPFLKQSMGVAFNKVATILVEEQYGEYT